jgi:hypothetical protein
MGYGICTKVNVIVVTVMWLVILQKRALCARGTRQGLNGRYKHWGRGRERERRREGMERGEWFP